MEPQTRVSRTARASTSRPVEASGGVAAYLRSASYLRPSQVVHRLRALVRRRVLHRLGAYRSRYQRLAEAGEAVRPIVLPAPPARDLSLESLAVGTFEFLNRARCLGRPVDWFPAGETQLWVYNLHYFDCAVPLAGRYVEKGEERVYRIFRDLVDEWMDSCPVATRIAWAPYPTSLRISNWIKAYQGFESALSEDSAFARRLRRSLYVQTAFLVDNLERDLQNNHLIENARALLLAGLFFTSERAQRWRQLGESTLWQALDEQFLDDGGNFELSPMYHQLMLELYDEVGFALCANGGSVPEEFSRRLESMRRWLQQTLHPDGKIALLNDAAFGIAGDPTPLTAELSAPRDGFTPLAESGYFTFRDRARGDFLIFDCGSLGPSHQLGHGHCDTLSFELSLRGKRLIVDSGVGTYYGELPWRTYYRSTRAHNTIAIDGAEQSEIWGRFRVARRAEPFDVKWSEEDTDCIWVAASHSGYRRLPGELVHRRWLCWVERCYWVVCDRITGAGEHLIESFLHLHPEAEVLSRPQPGGESCGLVRRGAALLQVLPWGFDDLASSRGQMEPIQGWYAPRFGAAEPSEAWSLSVTARPPIWAGYVLWPEQSTLEIDFAAAKDGSAQLALRAGDGIRKILYAEDGVALERSQ
jgi:uncharacterized heparinase superfamily protein